MECLDLLLSSFKEHRGMSMEDQKNCKGYHERPRTHARSLSEVPRWRKTMADISSVQAPGTTVRSMPREDNNVEVERTNERTGQGGVAWRSAQWRHRGPRVARVQSVGDTTNDSVEPLDSDSLEVAFTLSCSGSDKPMAPRRKCNVCGSQQWHKEPATGLVVCSEGHVLQVRGLVPFPFSRSRR